MRIDTVWHEMCVHRPMYFGRMCGLSWSAIPDQQRCQLYVGLRCLDLGAFYMEAMAESMLLLSTVSAIEGDYGRVYVAAGHSASSMQFPVVSENMRRRLQSKNAALNNTSKTPALSDAPT
eukprot:3423-Heterococcus_DN1.PRE.1